MNLGEAEFLGLPLSVWTFFATLALALITAVYVVLTYKIAQGAELAARAALASLNVELSATYWPPMGSAAIVSLRNLGATLHIHRTIVAEYFGEGEIFGETDVQLLPVESWGPTPWHLHKGEQRTFYWPSGLLMPGPNTVLVTVAVEYSIGATGERSTVRLPLDLRKVQGQAQG